MPDPDAPGTLTRRGLLRAMAPGLALPALSLKALAAAGPAPLRFTHAFGTSSLPRPARRVVSLGYTTQDSLLALGVAPLAVRYWFGTYPYGIWPWAQSRLGNAKPEVLTGEVSIERVAALKPDLILGIGSGISRAEYGVLSRIAPVLMQPVGAPVYGTPWDVMLQLIGRAVGRAAEAQAEIARVRGLFAAARQRHPDWKGKTAVAAYEQGGETGAFTGPDTRARFLAELGFQPTAALRRLSGPNNFYVDLSPEDLSPIDADVLVWISGFATDRDLQNLPMRRTLRAYREGREVYAGPLLAGALSFGSVLSMPFALARLEPEIAAAADGNPATRVASAVAAGLAP